MQLDVEQYVRIEFHVSHVHGMHVMDEDVIIVNTNIELMMPIQLVNDIIP
jgi:hypothetical protein